VAAGLATTPALLLTARAVQGLGGALLIPVTLSLLTNTFTERAARTRALGTWSAVGAIGAAAGPVIGGVLTQWAGWRWVFLISIPLGIATLIMSAVALPRRDQAVVRTKLDVLGATLATLGLVAIVYAVMIGGWAGLGMLVLGIALLGVFLLHQAKWATDPLLPLSVFRARTVSSGNVVMFLLGLGFFASPILISLYLQDVHGYSPLRAGLGFLPIGAAMFAGAQSAGRLTLVFGARRAAVVFCAIGALGLAGMAALFGPTTSYLVGVAIPGVVLGFGTAAAFTPITVIATSGVRPSQNGLAAGLLNTTRQTSGAIGLAMLSALAAAVSGAHSSAGGYSAAFFASAGCVVIAAIVAAVAMPAAPQSYQTKPDERLLERA
jgi:EmrB/QacA subfamily drug resistance transporter